ncbi:MAG: hypothetical protein CL946_01595 [Ectothiorhodospiraceae bacterium]|nr:hypothetical protein [Ectothiorhodospiraceae bacterium]
MIASQAQPRFSIDHLVTEVNTIVEDLRWQHFELKLRNQFNEILFREVTSIEEFLEEAFREFRVKIAALEVTVYLKNKNSYVIGYRDLEPSAFWENDPVPWTEGLPSLFKSTYESGETPQPVVSHYTVNNEPLTTLTMPTVINREVIAVMVIVAQSSNLIPRLKKLLTGLSSALSVSYNYIKNLRRLFSRTTSGAKKFADNTVPYDTMIQLLESTANLSSDFIVVFDDMGSISIVNPVAEAVTGRSINEFESIRTLKETFQLQHGGRSIEAAFSHEPISHIVAPIADTNGKPKYFSWSTHRFITAKNTLTMLIGTEHIHDESAEGEIHKGGSGASNLIIDDLLRSVENTFVMVLDTKFNIVHANEYLLDVVGSDNYQLNGRPFVSSLIPNHERALVESALHTAVNRSTNLKRVEQFHIAAAQSSTPLIEWHISTLPVDHQFSSYLVLIGSEIADEAPSETRANQQSPDARLSKHYRFLMKYVPFPIVHLDANEDVIRNANLAFEEIIGTRHWESAPISDFGTLEVADGVGDSLPCVLYIVNREGITVSCRGIITPIQIFGKHIREIKLDPVA